MDTVNSSVLLRAHGGGMRALPLMLIAFYQRYLSPRKGFACPHRLLHGGVGCSGHVKALLLDESLPWREALRASILRFQACGAAGQVLQQSGRPRVRCYVVPCCFPL